ncbi:aldose 1-epimerase [Enterococcus florum]|uniref:Aldose 1-epimerase n=1 Tax=Enterococcus florum TaxID=2480627 RepID=A0A4P5PGN7_9ENTE|nr:aldose epimerase family protein [Enterococcus florum]GCF92653.1 aldose 1-epimerase [Enterococcus florum]
MKKIEFGTTTEGEALYLFQFENQQGLKMSVSNLGAVLTHLWVPDQNNQLIDVVLGYDHYEQYQTNTHTFFGAVIGRNANRIANASFELAGSKYFLAKNEGENNLHSGPDGFQLRVWKVKELNEDQNRITFELRSPEGDQGFPGELICRVTYQLKGQQLLVSMTGKSDRQTVFNPTHHSYFNLNGHDKGHIMNHFLQVNAKQYTPVADEASIPTGEKAKVEGTPFDFRQLKRIGEEIDANDLQLQFVKGYDHNFVLDKALGELELAAVLIGDLSGIKLEVATTLPGIQVYTGNFVNNERGKQHFFYQRRAGICLETQFFPNAINEPQFDSPILPAGEAKEYTTIFTFAANK